MCARLNENLATQNCLMKPSTCLKSTPLIDDPLLFPLVTLIIMDVFIQKMRIKK